MVKHIEEFSQIWQEQIDLVQHTDESTSIDMLPHTNDSPRINRYRLIWCSSLMIPPSIDGYRLICCSLLMNSPIIDGYTLIWCSVPDHDGGRPMEVNACILTTHMVYL
jgi:hypothetical protein